MPWSTWILLILLTALPILALMLCLARLYRFLSAAGTLVMTGPPRARRLVERRAVWIPAAAYLGVVTLCGLYAWLVEPNWVEVTRTEIAVPRAVIGRDRLRIVHLSDVHLERLGSREQTVIDAVRAASPHIIVLTGDYLNARGAQNDFVSFLKALDAPLGVYAVGGHWDGKWPVPELFAGAGKQFHYLRDDFMLVEETKVLIVGQDYHPGRTLAQLLAGASEDTFRVFLQHSPDAIEELAGARADLFLCGHTHGGQVRLPFAGAIVTRSGRGGRYDQGRYEVRPPATANPRGTTMYVNRGIGTTGIAPPVRFLARPEVAIIDLVAR